MAEVKEHLPSKHEVLSSNQSRAKKKKKRNTLVLYHTICSDQRRDLASDIGSINLSPSGGSVILNHLDLINKTSRAS
jgi:hypothetical protein